jgi:hypothetical protein
MSTFLDLFRDAFPEIKPTPQPAAAPSTEPPSVKSDEEYTRRAEQLAADERYDAIIGMAGNGGDIRFRRTPTAEDLKVADEMKVEVAAQAEATTKAAEAAKAAKAELEAAKADALEQTQRAILEFNQLPKKARRALRSGISGLNTPKFWERKSGNK